MAERYTCTRATAQSQRDDLAELLVRHSEWCALVFAALTLVRGLHGGAGFVDCALGVVVGLHGEAVFIDSAVALTGAVEDAGQFDVAPDLDPLRVAVAAKSVAEGVGGGLIVALHEE